MSKPIMASFTRETGRWNGKTFVDREFYNYSKEIQMEIVDKDDKPILRFIGGPTGYESYYIKDFLKPWPNRPSEICICGGTINSYHRCSVPWKEVEQFLSDNGYQEK